MFLECSKLRFTYPDSAVNVLDQLSFTVTGPGFNAIFGPSGIGKTSLARILAGNIVPSAGLIKREGIQAVLYSCNLERLPGWATLAEHLDAVSPPGKKELRRELIRPLA